MPNDLFNKVYPLTQSEHGVYVLQKELDPELICAFLAKHPKTDDLFMMLTDYNESLIVCSGTLEKGLRICRPIRIEDTTDRLAVYFEHEDGAKCITTISQSGCFGPMLYPLTDEKPVTLELVPLHILEPFCGDCM
ncbi:MAG: hypothetical protein WC819_00435 [Parcubacteria group bacterium]|jgi:hypothetical protein